MNKISFRDLRIYLKRKEKNEGNKTKNHKFLENKYV